ncbi:MAG: hypothetical protein Kow00106_18910 [Anaerolineae bacterium]
MKPIALGIALILVLVMTPMALLAQGDDELETYTSEDGLLSVSYPSGWLTSVDEEAPFPFVIFVNTEEALERVEAGDDLASGDVGVLVVILPSEFLTFFGVMLDADAAPAEVAESVATAMLGPTPAADGTVEESEQVEFSEFEEVELTDEMLGGFGTAASATEEIAITIFSPGEGLLAIVYTATSAGELTEADAELSKTVAASLTYDGTAEDLMNAIMGGPIEEAPEDTTSENLDGAALVAERCTTCHTAERIDAASKDEADWAATVDRMIGYGAQLNSAERDTVIAYLSSR